MPPSANHTNPASNALCPPFPAELARAQVGTIRQKLFKVAVRVVVTARRIVFHLSSSYPYRELFQLVHDAVFGRPAELAPEGG